MLGAALLWGACPSSDSGDDDDTGDDDPLTPATCRSEHIAAFEALRFGAFLDFNDNQFVANDYNDYSANIDPSAYAPTDLDVSSWIDDLAGVGMTYAVLTTRHTSGFLLWDSATSEFDVGSSGDTTDVVGEFVSAAHDGGMVPVLYYCLWGSDHFMPWTWNPTLEAELEGTTPRELILAQLDELATRNGDVGGFWIDMGYWVPTT